VELFYNEIMRKIIIYLISLIFNFIFLTSLAANEINIENPLRWRTFQDLISAIINFLTAFAFAIFPIIIIIAGYQFMSAGGDPKKIEEAKQMIGYALVGLIVILAAQAILHAIKSVMGVNSVNSP
jgi:uncharacterized membrane protein